MSNISIEAGAVVINSTPIIGGTSQRLLYDNAGKIGETTNATFGDAFWDGTNLHSPFLEAITTSTHGPGLYAGLSTDVNSGNNWRFTAGLDSDDLPYVGFGTGTSAQDIVLKRLGSNALSIIPALGVSSTNNVSLNIQGAFVPIAQPGTFGGVYVRIVSDVQNRIFFALNALDNPLIGMGPGGVTVADVGLIRPAVATFALVKDPYNFGAGPTTFQVYNTLDAYTPANYERGITDWNKTANAFTVGTEAAGTGTARPLLLSPANHITALEGITSSFPALKRSAATLQFRLADDSAFAFYAWAGELRVSSQFNKAGDTTLATVTGLSISLAAGRTYAFRAYLNVSPDAVGGHKYAIGTPDTLTASNIIYQVNSVNNTTNANIINSRQTALGGSVGIASGTSDYTEIIGVITVGVAGTLAVQFAQNVASGTSSVLVGSFMIVQDMP